MSELEQKWRAEFEAFSPPRQLGSHAVRESRWQAYLAACRARHAEAEELRAENARLRETLTTAKLLVEELKNRVDTDTTFLNRVKPILLLVEKRFGTGQAAIDAAQDALAKDAHS